MLLLALACRHAAPPDPSAEAQQEVSVATCDTNAVTYRLQRQLGPQQCAVDSDCTSHRLAELAPMLSADVRQRLGDVDSEPNLMVYSTSLLLGRDTTLASLVDPAVELVRTCPPRGFRPAPGQAIGTNGAVLFVRPAESAQFVGPDGVTREQCVAEFETPACVAAACSWRPETRVVPCSKVWADSSM